MTQTQAEKLRCDACGANLPFADARTDDDGFTGCRPCFPISNLPADSNRFMRGPCHDNRTGAPQP